MDPKRSAVLGIPLVTVILAGVFIAVDYSNGLPGGVWLSADASQRAWLGQIRELAQQPGGDQTGNATRLASRLLASRPWNAGLWCELAELHEDDGRVEEAARIFEMGADLAPYLPL